MSNEKHKKYYRTTPEKKLEICAQYEEVDAKRKAVMQEIFDETGAIALATSSGWGTHQTVTGLVFEEDHPETKNPHYKTVFDRHEGKDVVIVSGKGNRKDGYALNKRISSYNQRMKNFPSLKDFVIDLMNVRTTGIGESTGKGIAMLSTQAGVAGDVIVLAIPYPGDKKITIPDYLEEISYGVFYDLVES